MDAFTLLRNDHREVESLFETALMAMSDEARNETFDKIRRDLQVHTQIEEEIFYPALEQYSVTSSMVSEARDQHDEIDDHIKQVDQSGADDPLWRVRVERLRDKVQAHVREEEDRIFPQARLVLTSQDQNSLGERLERRKQELQRSAVGEMAETAAAVKQQAREKAGWFADTMKSQGRHLYSEQAGRFGGQASGIADALRQTANSLRSQGNDDLSKYVESAADGLQRFSRSLQETDPERTIRTVTDFARRQPALFLGGAVIAGIAAGRFLRSSSSGPTEEYEGYEAEPEYAYGPEYGTAYEPEAAGLEETATTAPAVEPTPAPRPQPEPTSREIH